MELNSQSLEHDSYLVNFQLFQNKTRAYAVNHFAQQALFWIFISYICKAKYFINYETKHEFS